MFLYLLKPTHLSNDICRNIHIFNYKIRPSILYMQVNNLPFHQSPVGQTDAVFPQDVRHRQRDPDVSGHITQPLVKLLKLLWNRKTITFGSFFY